MSMSPAVPDFFFRLHDKAHNLTLKAAKFVQMPKTNVPAKLPLTT
jgi:hypothetical protein